MRDRYIKKNNQPTVWNICFRTPQHKSLSQMMRSNKYMMWEHHKRFPLPGKQRIHCQATKIKLGKTLNNQN